MKKYLILATALFAAAAVLGAMAMVTLLHNEAAIPAPSLAGPGSSAAFCAEEPCDGDCPSYDPSCQPEDCVVGQTC